MASRLIADLAQTEALAMLLIEKGVITEAAFRAKLAQERARAKKAHRDSFRRESFAPCWKQWTEPGVLSDNR